MIAESFVAMALLVAAGQQPETIAPARLVSGSVTPVPIAMLAGGEVFLEVIVDVNGRVAGITPFRVSPPLTDLVTDAVRGWRFDASQKRAESETGVIRFAIGIPQISKVFVAAVFRPPALHGPTLGSAPQTVSAPGDDIPVPVVVKTPPFPVSAFGAGVVLVEMRVEADGSVSDACVIESAPPFDGPAIDAARQWRFRPARVDGAPAPAYAYVLFGFPLPIH